MRNFFALKYFYEAWLFFVLQFLFLLDGYMLIKTTHTHMRWFNLDALLCGFGVWAISAIIDRKKYLNLSKLIVVLSFGYFVFWVMFEIVGKAKW